MVPVAVAVAIMSAQLNGSVARERDCSPLGSDYISELVGRVKERRGHPRLAALADLKEYWDSVCRADRANADIKVVLKLSELLKIPDSRFIVSAMMIDSERNLSAALPRIKSAMADQRKLDRDSMNKAYPYYPTTGERTYCSLKCLRIKIENGEESSELCRFIRNLDLK